MAKIKIGLVDDHVIFRKSLRVLIETLLDFEVSLEAGNGIDLMHQIKKGNIPDILLLDITMPLMDGVEASWWLRQHFPQIKVLALSMIRNDFIIIRMLKNGIRGYILKDCEPAELRLAIREVHEKGYYYNELLTPKMRSGKNYNDNIFQAMISEPELAFMRWACTDKTHKEIAAEMRVSHRTIDGYRDSLFKKLEVSTRVGIAIYAIKNGLVQI